MLVLTENFEFSADVVTFSCKPDMAAAKAQTMRLEKSEMGSLDVKITSCISVTNNEKRENP